MKIASIVARYLLGLLFTVFGLNGFLHFIHQPPPANPLALQFFGAVSASHFAAFFFAIQVFGGLLLISGFFVPLALTLRQFISQSPREQLQLSVVRAFQDGPYVVTQAKGQAQCTETFSSSSPEGSHRLEAIYPPTRWTAVLEPSTARCLFRLTITLREHHRHFAMWELSLSTPRE